MSDETPVMERKILIVDDEYSIREALHMYFSGEGYKTVQAANGLEAVNILEKEDFDIIVSDIRMDKLDGVGLIKKLKNHDKNIPVIFITAYPEYNTAVEALRYGAVEYMTKPFQMKELEEKVSEAIRNRLSSGEECLAKKYKEEKKLFLDRFSHELRSPLTPMSAYVQLLLKEEFGEVSARQAEVLRNIQKNNNRLKKLTDDIILLYSLENNEEIPDINETDVAVLIEDAVNEERFFIKEREQDVEITIYDGIEMVKCDPAMIKRVVYHLLDNAIKFSPESSKINIMIRKFKFNLNEYVKFSIKDSGEKLKGINKRVIFRLFHDVKRGMDMPGSVNQKGLGIGLTLSRVIVEAHNGRIWFEEDSDDNSNICSFILPE